MRLFVLFAFFATAASAGRREWSGVLSSSHSTNSPANCGPVRISDKSVSLYLRRRYSLSVALSGLIVHTAYSYIVQLLDEYEQRGAEPALAT